MELRFQPALLQEVIDSFVEKTEREGDPTYYKEFHELADPIYEKFTLDDRESEFKKLYQYLFGTWGFSDIIRDAYNEYPLVKEQVGIVLVKGVLKEDQEGVDILRKWGSVEQDMARKFEEKGLKGVGIKLIPRRFYDPALTAEVQARQENYIAHSHLVTAAMVASWPIRQRLFNNTIAMLGPVL